MLQSMGSQRVGHDIATEHQWTVDEDCIFLIRKQKPKDPGLISLGDNS